MLAKVTLAVIFVIVGTNCEESKPKTFEKNGLLFTVQKGEFIIDGASIPTLNQSAITDIKEMERLWLTRSKINKIEPGAFQNLPNLKAVYITYNSLSRIEVGVFNDLNITSLSLSDNGIEYIAAHAFDNMTYLAIVDFSFNKLRQWDISWFAETLSVEHFFLNYNLFAEIPANAFGGHKRTGDFYYISLEGNPIKRIDDDAFKNFKTLSNLHISVNTTDVLSGNFLKPTYFRKVDITIDNVECLDKTVWSQIFIADSTKLRGNAFDRTCKDNIAKWATEHQKTVIVSIGW